MKDLRFVRVCFNLPVEGVPVNAQYRWGINLFPVPCNILGYFHFPECSPMCWMTDDWWSCFEICIVPFCAGVKVMFNWYIITKLQSQRMVSAQLLLHCCFIYFFLVKSSFWSDMTKTFFVCSKLSKWCHICRNYAPKLCADIKGQLYRLNVR